MIEVIFWPLLAAILVVLCPKQRAAQWLNLLLHIPWIILIVAFIKAVPGNGAFSYSEVYALIPLFKSKIAFGADALNLSLAALTVFLSTCLSFYYLNHEKMTRGFLMLFQLLNFATMASLFSADLFLFYIFWEFMLIPLFFLIGIWGSENRVYAALKFFAMTLAGSLGLLAAIFFISSQTFMPSLEWTEIAKHSTELIALAPWLIWAFLLAFLVKVPLWPLHTWLPDAHTEAPTGVSVVLAGVLLKLGVYGMMRWCLGLFPDAYFGVADILLVASIIGIIIGSFGALRQKDIKAFFVLINPLFLG